MRMLFSNKKHLDNTYERVIIDTKDCCTFGLKLILNDKY